MSPAVSLSGSGAINITDSTIAGALSADQGIFCTGNLHDTGPQRGNRHHRLDDRRWGSAWTPGPVQVPITLRNTRVAGSVGLACTLAPINLIGGSMGSLYLTGNERPITISSERVGPSIDGITTSSWPAQKFGTSLSGDIFANTGEV